MTSGALVVLREHLERQLGVTALLLVGQRLADVVEQAHALGELHVGLDLGRHHPRQPRDLLGVLQAVLAVGGAELHPADQLDQLGMQPVHAHLEAGLLALLLEVLLHLLLDLLDDLLDPGRMDAAVGQELLERAARDLAAVGIVGGDEHGLRGVVDDEVDARVQLERPDVAAFAADDAALHVVGRQVDHRDRGLDRVVGRQPLDGRGQDFLGLHRARSRAPPPRASSGAGLASRRASTSIWARSWRLASSAVRPAIDLELAPLLVDGAGPAGSPSGRAAARARRAPAPCSCARSGRRSISSSLRAELFLLGEDALLDLLHLALAPARLGLELSAEP